MINITAPFRQNPKAIASQHRTRKTVNKIVVRNLLACGVISSLLYVANNIITVMFYKGYDPMSQTVSELSAIGSPTRVLWNSLNLIYSALVIAFGLGICYAAGKVRTLRILGILMFSYIFFGLLWPPMHQRKILAAGGGSITDTLHIVWTFLTVILMLSIIWFASKLFGKGFRVYSLITVALLLSFGGLTGMASPSMEANLPTPWMGVWERICIGAYMLWMLVLSLKLLDRQSYWKFSPSIGRKKKQSH